MVQERRQHPRFYTKIDLVVESKKDPWKIKIINAGQGGGFVKSKRKVKINSSLKIRYGKLKTQIFKARVIHKQPNGFALQFINPPDDFLNKIPKPKGWESFIKNHPDYQGSVARAVFLTWPLYQLIKMYNKLEVFGTENIPFGSRFVWTQNHSGWFAIDGPIVAYTIARNNPVERFDWDIKKMGPLSLIKKFFDLEVGDWGINFWNNLLFKLPIVPDILKTVHGQPVKILKNMDKLKEYRIYGTPAEGEEGNCKSSITDLYRLQRFRTGVAHLALEAKVDYILPIMIVGPEESLINLGPIRFFKKIFGTIIPMPLLNFPLPVKWIISFLPPIDVRSYHKKYDAANKDKKREICQIIMKRVKKAIAEELRIHTKNRVPFLPWFLNGHVTNLDGID